MDASKIIESLYKYLLEVGVYTKETVAGFVGLTIDREAYKRITGDAYAEKAD